MGDESGQSGRVLLCSKDGGVSEHALSGGELSCSHEGIGEELVESMFPKEHVVGVQVEAPVGVYCFGTDDVGNDRHFVVGTALVPVHYGLHQLIPLGEVLPRYVLLPPQEILVVWVGITQFLHEELFELGDLSPHPDLMDLSGY